MQEVYYVYRPKKAESFRIIPDRGRRLTDIEVDVSISHQENTPLGSIKWHKVIVNPTDHQMESRFAYKGMGSLRLRAEDAFDRQTARRWQSLLSIAASA